MASASAWSVISAPVEAPPADTCARARARASSVSFSAAGISSPWYTHTFTPICPNVVFASAVPKSMRARSVCSGTRPSRYHSRRDISVPPRRPPHCTRTPRAPARIAVWTARRMARRNETLPASCSATP